MRRAAEAIRDLGARAVLVKGGHRAIEHQTIGLLLDESGRLVELREKISRLVRFTDRDVRCRRRSPFVWEKEWRWRMRYERRKIM